VVQDQENLASMTLSFRRRQDTDCSNSQHKGMVVAPFHIHFVFEAYHGLLDRVFEKGLIDTVTFLVVALM
jgi:hypothetical protein